eukprot:scaffold3376_cov151-Amphora_coffeaeformis.AAC.1
MAVINNVGSEDNDKEMEITSPPSSLPASPPRINNNNHDNHHQHHHEGDDDPSQMTDDDAGRTLDSRRSAFSFEHVRSVFSQAGDILVGRLPNNTAGIIIEEGENGDHRPSVIEFNGTSPRSAVIREASQELDPTPRAVVVTDAEDDSQVPIHFLQDNPREMTLARRIALSLHDKTWYNPSLLVAQQVEELENSEAFKTAQQSYETPKGGRLMDAYPFTVSKREKPSLAKAWACKF